MFLKHFFFLAAESFSKENLFRCISLLKTELLCHLSFLLTPVLAPRSQILTELPSLDYFNLLLGPAGKLRHREQKVHANVHLLSGAEADKIEACLLSPAQDFCQ